MRLSHNFTTTILPSNSLIPKGVNGQCKTQNVKYLVNQQLKDNATWVYNILVQLEIKVVVVEGLIEVTRNLMGQHLLIVVEFDYLEVVPRSNLHNTNLMEVDSFVWKRFSVTEFINIYKSRNQTPNAKKKLLIILYLRHLFWILSKRS